MYRKKLVTRLASGTAVAALAFAGVACDAEGGGELDPGMEEAPEGDLEGEGDLGGEEDLGGEADAGGEGDLGGEEGGDF